MEEEGHIRLGSLIEDNADKINRLKKQIVKLKQQDLKDEEDAIGENMGIDTISEPYMFKVGDVIHNVNPSCPHYGSKGIVISMDPNDMIRYMVTNNGGSYEPGDILNKSSDQLEPM